MVAKAVLMRKATITCEVDFMDFEIITNSPQETIELGKKIGKQLKGGEVVSLVGNLGAGKTHLIKGIVAGVRGDEEGNEDEVNSPTFVLINEYLGGRLDLYHIDAYRLDTTREFEMLGFDDLCYDDSVVLIEWANKIEQSLEGVNLLRLELWHESQTQRKIVLPDIPDYIQL